MMKKNTILAGGFTVTFLFALTLLVLTPAAGANSEVVAIEGVNYNVASSVKDNLQSLLDKKVSVTLDSGTTITGFVKDVGDHLLHLDRLEGKEYFDALLRIENIIAIETRFRKIER